MSNQKPNFPLYETGKRTNQAQIKQVEGNNEDQKKVKQRLEKQRKPIKTKVWFFEKMTISEKI